jgi:hypothetical protein
LFASGAKAFHEWLLDYIGDQKKAFAADLGSDYEVWYYPVYAYEMESSRNENSEDVTVTISYAVHKKPDYMGTEERRKRYTYRLGLDSSGNIVSGVWTGGSVDNHPKTLSYPEATSPRCPYIDCDIIREIAQARDDHLELEGNEATRLLPGSHNLVLLNEDVYFLKGQVGSVISLDMIKQDGSGEAMYVEIVDADDVIVRQQTLEQGGDSLSWQFSMENPPYNIKIEQENYLQDPNVYSLDFDFKGDCVRHVPYIPKNGPWSGFAITNPSDEVTAEVMLVTLDGQGKPLQTVMGPTELLPGQKHLVHFSQLPVRKHEMPDTESVKLISDHPVELVNLFAGIQGPMAGFSNLAPINTRLVLPCLYDNDPWDTWSMTGGVFNLSFKEVELAFDIYSSGGIRTSTHNFALAERSTLPIRSGRSPFSLFPDQGWMQIQTDEQGVELFAYQYLQSNGSDNEAMESAFALPVISGSLFVQHVTPASGVWLTLLTLINPNNAENTVVIHPAANQENTSGDAVFTLFPFEKQVIDLSARFDGAAGQSILEISGNQPLAGQVRYKPENGDSVSYPLLAYNAFKSELVMPHTAYNNRRWYTGVGVCNPNAYPVTIFITPHDSTGEPLAEPGEYIHLGQGAYEVFTVHDLFPAQADSISFLKIQCVDPSSALIGGFYLYGNAAAQDLKPRKMVSGGNM